MDDVEPNMTPIMNLMVVLIPLLLSSAQLIKISVIELNLPPAKGNQTLQKPKEKELRLDLAVMITDKGFYVSSSSAVLQSEASKPSIPLKNGEYDFEALGQKLYEIKMKAEGNFEDTESIVIQAEPRIGYQTLVSTMDSTRLISVEGEPVMLFPNVSVSALVL
jgi:biopolymer transport protein ExbD